ncbi:MAG: calcium-translocating P-type ATPase, SERCA-type [Nanobdellota archaeon]
MKDRSEPWHAESIETVFKNLDSTDEGLTKREGRKRLEEFGYNKIKNSHKISPLNLFLKQFKDFLVVLLLIAAIVSFIVGAKKGSSVDGWVIIGILLLNAIIGFFQELKAEKSIEALKKMASVKSTVIREGNKCKIDTECVVPGDILYLETGDKIPADARIIEASNFKTDESALTGESKSVSKVQKLLKRKTQLADKVNMVFSGTIATKGCAKAIVVNTGMNTEIGKIAKMVQGTQNLQTPLQKRLAHFGETLGIGILGICVVVFFLALLNYNGSILDALMMALSLAVAAIPEGLPVVVTICLALGVRSMVKKNALIRKLPSVETLGCTDVICTDKTGTLTYNEMTVREIYTNEQLIEVSGHGYEPHGEFTIDDKKVDIKNFELFLKAGVLCNNSGLYKKKSHWKINGDATEGALTVLGAKANINKKKTEKEMPRIKENPFESERKMMSTINKYKNTNYVFAKGAPDILIKKCTKIYVKGKTKKLTQNDKDTILQKNSGMAKRALRVLGVAYKKKDNKKDEEKLVFLGLVGMMDPPRHEVISSIKKCHDAGINVKMITGDHKETAIAIAKELGIGQYAISGDEIDKIEDLRYTAEHVDVYARVQPEHKLRIVNALKKSNHVVAMTGDGVNDAPALKGSDIGVSMGITGTDVSKEASDMILLDDNFSSIVNAVEEGRGIYDNIKKFIKYLLSSNSGEVLSILLGTIIGFSLAGQAIPLLLPIHLLFINLVTDSFLALALGVEPLSPRTMKRKPRKQKENFIQKKGVFDILITGAVMSIGTIFIFKKSLYSPAGSENYAWSMALTTLIIFQLFNVFNCKSETRSVFSNFYNNKWLILAVLGCMMMVLGVLYTPLSTLFKVSPLGLADWGLIILVTLTIVLVMELKKLLVFLFSKLHNTRI